MKVNKEIKTLIKGMLQTKKCNCGQMSDLENISDMIK